MEEKLNEWVPGLDEYNPRITKEQWTELIKDKNIFTENSLITFACIQKARVATCAGMAAEFGRSSNFYNNNNWRTGERVYKKTGCPLSERDEGGNRFWSVCCLGKRNQSYWEFRIRPELQAAFEETGVLVGIEVMEKKSSFTWIPFYMELAEKLYDFKNKRQELLDIIYGFDKEIIKIFYNKPLNQKFQDFHPFAIYGIFNRNITNAKRKDICAYLKEQLEVNAEVPLDFEGIPVVNNLNSWWSMPWQDNSFATEIHENWNLFNSAIGKNSQDFDFVKCFDLVRRQKNVKWSLTFALYWIRPYDFMPLDANSREYLKKIGIEVFDEKDLNGQNYLDLCKLIKEKITNNEIKEKSIPEISCNAWLKETINFWSGGINWDGENKLEEFSTNNYWQIGWDKDEVTKSAKEAWKNIREIKVGDLLSFHGYGGRNDLKIYQISKVIGKDEDEGKLLIKKLNSDDDILFHNKAPKIAHGWFGTLFQVTGEEAINKVFGNYIQGNTQMTKEDEFVEKYRTLLKNTKNLILTGAPGTGKSYLAKQIAAAMGCEEENIGFVQFHPSYDYTDFVEGLRPTDKDGNGNVGFERKDGVFKAFCEKALKNWVDSSKTAEEVADEELLKDKINQYLENILDENKPIRLLNGNDFFITDFDENKLNISNPNNEKTSELQVSINDIFLLLSNNVELKNVRDIKKYFGRTWATQQDSYVFVLCKEIEKIQTTKAEITEKIPLKPFVFIIDEINRGEVAKIFGELFYCVDPGYRGKKGRIKTQYQNLIKEGEFQEGFFIPENVYIIGTMNDIDRSVESMDFAFRRRFTWAEVKAEDTQYMLDAELNAVLADEAKRRMKNLNSAISGIEGLGTAYHIGASYFLKLDNYDGDFEQLWKYHLKGILEEYLRGNPEKDELMKQLEKAYQE